MRVQQGIPGNSYQPQKQNQNTERIVTRSKSTKYFYVIQGESLPSPEELDGKTLVTLKEDELTKNETASFFCEHFRKELQKNDVFPVNHQVQTELLAGKSISDNQYQRLLKNVDKNPFSDLTLKSPLSGKLVNPLG